jgi:RimJ/RimL family protein N-acetyltransferase
MGSPVSLEPVTLPGTHVSLRPLTTADVPALAVIAGDPRIWTYLTARADSAAGMARYVDDLLEAWRNGTGLPFVIASAAGTTLGLTRLKEICATHRRATIGSWLAPIAWGTGANTESKRLLLAHAFESLGLLRIEFQTDSENIRSRTALARLGIREEGVLRRHQLRRDGSRRDTVVFSVIADEWLAVRSVIDARLRAQM